MSEYVEHRASVEHWLGQNVKRDRDQERNNIAKAQVWATLALAATIRDVADALRFKPREQ
ncbi:MAG TPA: hypothetical protein VIY28_00185 [Pseudonocardiaceae bacterium]